MTEQTISWYDSQGLADRRIGLTLWPSGGLYCAIRLKPTDTWSPSVLIGENITEDEAEQFARRFHLIREPALRRKVTLDYSVPLTVTVDLDTKRVESVWLHLEDFQSGPRGRFKQGDHEVMFRNVFFGDLFEDEADEGFIPEYACDGEHPLADEALAIGDSIKLVEPEFQLAFEEDAR